MLREALVGRPVDLRSDPWLRGPWVPVRPRAVGTVRWSCAGPRTAGPGRPAAGRRSSYHGLGDAVRPVPELFRNLPDALPGRLADARQAGPHAFNFSIILARMRSGYMGGVEDHLGPPSETFQQAAGLRWHQRVCSTKKGPTMVTC